MSNYTVDKLSDGLWRIYDFKGDSAYLIEGGERALLVDTAMCNEPLMPLIRTLTDKPVSLALTHAHIDHMYRCGEFQTVYLHKLDIDDWKKGNGAVMTVSLPIFKVKRKRYDVKSFIPLYDGSRIDLGGFSVKVIRLSGHTRGSVLFADDHHKAVLCGDAIGLYMWLFLPFSTGIREYKAEVERTEKSLLSYADYKYFGGHCSADGTPQSDLSYGVLSDMRVLCDKLLNGTADIKNVKQIPALPLLYARCGTAGIVFRKGKLK